MRSLALPCSSCGRLACTLTLPRLPDDARGIVSTVVSILNVQLLMSGSRRLPSVPESGELAELIPADKLPEIARLLNLKCAACVATDDASAIDALVGK